MENENRRNMKRFTGSSGSTSFFLSINATKMEAYIQILGSGQELVIDDIVSAVKEMGITRGVSRKIVEFILSGKHGKDPILFAKGVPAQTGEDGWFEFFFRTNLEKKPKILEDGSVDYLNVEWFEVVEEGQKLVEYHPAGEGVVGVNVFGEELPAKKGRDKPPIKGKGFTMSDDKLFYYAEMGGRIEFKNNRMEVMRLLVIDELSLVTGNLDFDGSVQVKGNVGSGVTLRATEDIVIDGFVESANVICGGSIMFRLGMNASGEGFVKAKEYIAGKFFEAVSVECGGEIQADYFLNCTLLSREQIIVSGKLGSIAGGSAYAMLGFVARNAGNRIGLSTHLRVGANNDIILEQMEIEEKLKLTAKEVEKLKNAKDELELQLGREECQHSEKYKKISGLYDERDKLLLDLYVKSDDIAAYIAKLKKAQIIVYNTLYEGVTCEINNQKYVPEQLKNAIIKMVENKIAVFENRAAK